MSHNPSTITQEFQEQASKLWGAKIKVPYNIKDLSLYKFQFMDWDFQIDGVQYEIVKLDDFPHDDFNNCFYCLKIGESFEGKNLQPYHQRWEPCEFKISIEQEKSWKYEYNNIIPREHYIGKLLRNGEVIHTETDPINDNPGRIVTKLNSVKFELIKNKNLNITSSTWKQKLIGKNVEYNEKKYKIAGIKILDTIHFILDNAHSHLKGMHIRWNNPKLIFKGN